MTTTVTNEAAHCAHCAYCGHPISPGDDVPHRFGERFCSEAHAEEFVAGVRAARIDHAVRARDRGANGAVGGACAAGASGQPGPGGTLWRALCWGAPLPALVGILVWAGGWAPTGGSLLTGLALLACPLGMYFMMRSMTSMAPHPEPAAGPVREDRDA
jgi:hypothetical protein